MSPLRKNVSSLEGRIRELKVNFLWWKENFLKEDFLSPIPPFFQKLCNRGLICFVKKVRSTFVILRSSTFVFNGGKLRLCS